MFRPIAPPPRIPRSRKDRKKQPRKACGDVIPSSSPIKSWLPFGDECRCPAGDSLEETFFNALDHEVGIVTSCSGEDTSSLEGVEMQLRSSLDPMWHDSTSFDEQSLSDLAPIPPPNATTDITQNDVRLACSESTEIFSNNAFARKLMRLQPNQKIVKRIGMTKSTSSSQNDDEAKIPSRRGRSMSTTRNTRTKSAIGNRPPRSLSLKKPKKSKKKKEKVPRRSRSIVRVRANRSESSGEDKNSTDSADESNEVESQVKKETNRSSDVRDSVQPSAPIQIHSRNGIDAPIDEIPSNLGGPFPTTPVANTQVVSSDLTLPSVIRTRNLLETSVYHNEATGIWITTINMSQKETVSKSNASKYLKAFSFQTEHEARESAYANAPAKMIPFDENPFCFLCSAQFSVFKRAAHCRNCGVCICNTCSVGWNKTCIPETYNIKGETSIKVCRSCDTLSEQFRRALLDANYEDALKIYNSGNVNLRCPFKTNKGGEALLPVHSAAEGGSIDLLEWLVEVHYCPLKRIRTGNRNKTHLADELITTSKGRSVLEIAMANQSVEILRYLVCEKGIGFDGIRDLNVALNALEAVLKSPYMIHPNGEDETPMTPIQRANSAAPPTPELARIRNGLPSFAISGIDEFSESEDDSPRNVDLGGVDSDEDQSVATTVHDACIICYANSIDCVITPCGHQICCLQCSKNLKTCPVCNANCKFIRIFRP